MAKHGCKAAYFADDKDISDILEQGRFTEEKLREYARKRGIFFGKDASKELLIPYLRKILCDWNQICELVEVLDTTERTPHMMPENKEGKFSDEDILKAVESLKAEHKKLGIDSFESISLTKSSENQYKLQVSYHENHWNKTRLLQTEPKVATVLMTRELDRVKCQVEDNAKARQIFNMLPLTSPDSPVVESRSIDLSEVKTPKQRTALFIELIKSIYGHQLHDVSNVNVEYMKPTDEAEDPTDEEAEKKKREEIKSKLKSAALNGSGLLRDRRYQELVNSDYYLCKVAWTIDHDSGNGDRVALSAEFSEPENGKGFRYSVLGKWTRNSDGELKKTRERMPTEELKKMQDHVAQAAFEAYDFVTSDDFALDDDTEDEQS